MFHPTQDGRERVDLGASGYLNADTDPTYGIAPRPWIGIKFGYETRGVRELKLFEDYVYELRDALYVRGVLLRPAPMRSLLVTDSLKEVQEVMTRFFSSSTESRLPILFLVDDYVPQNAIKAELERAYKDDMYIFVVTGSELDDMRRARSFQEAKSWCDEFVQNCIVATEGQLDFDPAILNVDRKQMRLDEERAAYAQWNENARRGMEEEGDLRMERRKEAENGRNREQYNGGGRDDYGYEDYTRDPYSGDYGAIRANDNSKLAPNGVAAPHAAPSQSRSGTSKLRKRYEYSSSSGQYTEVEVPERTVSSSSSTEDVFVISNEVQPSTSQAVVPPDQESANEPSDNSMVGLDVIHDAIEEGRGLPADSNDLICHIAGDFLFARFSRPFPQLVDNLAMLELCCMALSTRMRTEKVQQQMNVLLKEIAKSRLLIELCEYYGRLALDDPHLKQWAADFYRLLEYIARIFLTADEVLSMEEKQTLNDAWRTYSDLLGVIPSHFWDIVPQVEYEWLKAAVDRLAGTSDADDNSVIRPRPYTPVTPVNQPQARKDHRDEGRTAPPVPAPPPARRNPSPYAQLWLECEQRQPPEDFRLLSEIPQRRDLHRPEKPYLRRCITNGVYENTGHYLDVIFRLMREDLLSPLRDGLDLYRKNGSSRFHKNLGEEGMTSDIAIYEVSSIGGRQAKFQTGEVFRYVTLTQDSLCLAVSGSGRSLMFGQIVCLSLDGFREDINLAVVTERRDETLLNEGVLGLMFPDDRNIVKGKKYSMAEPSSYLEAYQHVLRVIKNISKFRPIPMERYLVHCKKNLRKPLYIRSAESEEEMQEKAAVIAHYECVRVQAQADKIAKQEAKIRKLGQRRRVKEDGECSSSSESSFSCGEFDEDPGPIFPQRRIIANETVVDKMKIDGQLYRVDNLDSEFQPATFDASQKKAFIAALTTELAVIQGPPGTGKTFIGVEIVRTMLQNRQRFANMTPILLVCYTNTALDQFLEKIVEKVPDDIDNGFLVHNGPIAVRLGSKSESTKLSRANVLRADAIREWKTELAMEQDSEFGKQMGRKRKEGAVLGTMAYTLGASKRRLLSFHSFMHVMSESHLNEFQHWAYVQTDAKRERLSIDEALASWLLDRTFSSSPRKATGGQRKQRERKRDGDSDSDSDFETKAPSASKKTILAIEKDSEDEEIEEEVEQTLEQLFRNINLDAVNDGGRFDDGLEDEYEVDRKWDMVVKDPGCITKVAIFGNETRNDGYGKSTPMDPEIISALLDCEEDILRAKPCTTEEYNDIRSIFSITKMKRWELYAYWTQKMRAAIRRQLPAQCESFKRACEKCQAAQTALDAKVMKKALIIGATTTGAAKSRDLLERLGCRILVVEESAEVLEAHTLSAMLPSLEHAVFIGDHQQLRPNPAVYHLGREYGLEISMFERLIKNDLPYSTLQMQHRMNTTITRTIVRPHFYNGLIDHEFVLDYPEVAGMQKSLFFWQHMGPESTPFESASYKNEQEVEMVSKLVDYITKQGVYGYDEITIIATYSAQTEALRKAISRDFGTNAANTGPAIAVETVDSFQGKENKIIIVSLVRSFGDTVGFLAVPNRICVALTRAQHGMYIVGNLQHLASRSNLWADIADSLYDGDAASLALPVKCKSHGKITNIYHPSEFDVKAPDGGCNESCGTRLPCGHVCIRRCHPIDDHQIKKCTQQCERPCLNPAYKHKCRKLCFEDCGPCSEMVAIQLSCGHSTTAPCYKLEKAVCNNRCRTRLECGHECAEICGKPCTTTCVEPVLIPHACGHSSSVPCHLSRGLVECSADCDEELPCGHQCAERCGQLCTFECAVIVTRQLSCGHPKEICCHESPKGQTCEFAVEHTLSTCGHTVCIPCYAGADPTKCPKVCGKTLDCGHRCIQKCGQCQASGSHQCGETCAKQRPCGHLCVDRCGQPCSTCNAACLTSCTHQRCGSANTRVGVTSIAYGRTCSQLCALCPKACDNTCEHRSCTRRCWEVCDVKACDEPCKRRLDCGHACLGMCSEKCPAVCGTCSKSKYLSALQILPESEREQVKIHRLIHLPTCGHVLPVQTVDEAVRGSKQSGSWPRCPKERCGQPIEGVMRYAKIIKKIVLDMYTVKELGRSLSLRDANEEFRRLTSSLGDMLKTIDRMKGNVKKQHAARLSSMIPYYRESLDSVLAAREFGEEKCVYWVDYVSCLSALLSLVKTFVTMKDIPRTVHNPPELASFVDHVCAGGRLQQAVCSSLDATVLWLRSHIHSEKSGVVLPKTRFLLQKTVFYLAIAKLVCVLNRAKIDLSASQAKDLHPLAMRFINSGPDSNFEGIYSNFANFIYEKIMVVEGLEAQWNNIGDLQLPAF